MLSIYHSKRHHLYNYNYIVYCGSCHFEYLNGSERPICLDSCKISDIPQQMLKKCHIGFLKKNIRRTDHVLTQFCFHIGLPVYDTCPILIQNWANTTCSCGGYRWRLSSTWLGFAPPFLGFRFQLFNIVESSFRRISNSNPASHQTSQIHLTSYFWLIKTKLSQEFHLAQFSRGI